VHTVAVYTSAYSSSVYTATVHEHIIPDFRERIIMRRSMIQHSEYLQSSPPSHNLQDTSQQHINILKCCIFFVSLIIIFDATVTI